VLVVLGIIGFIFPMLGLLSLTILMPSDTVIHFIVGIVFAISVSATSRRRTAEPPLAKTHSCARGRIPAGSGRPHFLVVRVVANSSSRRLRTDLTLFGFISFWLRFNEP
jgi:hypothetical protein